MNGSRATPSSSVRVVLVQTALPDYRQSLLDALSEGVGGQFQLVSGRDHFAPSTRLGVALPGRLTVVRNRFFLGRRLLWQSGAARAVKPAEVVLAEMNPRILSTWWILIVRALRRRRTVLWGHAWSRRNRSALRELIRRAMCWLADTVVVYTHLEARRLVSNGWNKRILAAPNSLWSRREMTHAEPSDVPRDFLYVGRLIPAKKPGLLLRAFSEVSDHLPGSRLIVIGEGPLGEQLREAADGLGIAGRVVFAGSVSDPAELRPYYARALATASPGYVGLSLIQSLGFGVPQIIARDEPHSPEIEAAAEGENAIMFRSDSVDDLARALLDVAGDSAKWTQARPGISRKCASEYSLEVTLEGLLQALQPVAERSY